MVVIKKFNSAAVLMLLVLMVSGCAREMNGWPSHATTVTHSPTQTPLSNELSAFFETAAAGASTQATVSPWGEQVQITTAEIYDAASGRSCRRITVRSPMDVPQQGLVCRSQPQQWVKVRMLVPSL